MRSQAAGAAGPGGAPERVSAQFPPSSSCLQRLLHSAACMPHPSPLVESLSRLLPLGCFHLGLPDLLVVALGAEGAGRFGCSLGRPLLLPTACWLGQHKAKTTGSKCEYCVVNVCLACTSDCECLTHQCASAVRPLFSVAFLIIFLFHLYCTAHHSAHTSSADDVQVRCAGRLLRRTH